MATILLLFILDAAPRPLVKARPFVVAERCAACHAEGRCKDLIPLVRKDGQNRVPLTPVERFKVNAQGSCHARPRLEAGEFARLVDEVLDAS